MDRVDRAVARYNRKKKETTDALEELHAAIAEQWPLATKYGEKTKLARKTGYTLERLRQIVQEQEAKSPNPVDNAK